MFECENCGAETDEGFGPAGSLCEDCADELELIEEED